MYVNINVQSQQFFKKSEKPPNKYNEESHKASEAEDEGKPEAIGLLNPLEFLTNHHFIIIC